MPMGFLPPTEPIVQLPEIDYSGTLAAALELATMGIPVFPVALIIEGGKVQKRPLVQWTKRASTDETQIRAWFTNTSMLIGVPTGKASGFDVLDKDPRHGGNAWWAMNEHRLPRSIRNRTLQGGTHLLLRHREGLRNSTGRIAPGIDVRGDGGFVIWWQGHGMEAEGAQLEPCPEWLFELATASRGRTKASGTVRLGDRKPPSPQHVVDLLDQLPNPPEATRDVYVDLMLAAKGCIDALGEAGELEDVALEDAIIEAAANWAERWEEARETGTNERKKWHEDWAHRDAPLAGWQTLIRIAGRLNPEAVAKLAAEEFGQVPDLGEPYRGNPHWPGMLLRNKARGVRANLLTNCVVPLRHAPEWQGVLAFNQFTHGVDVLIPPPGGSTEECGYSRALEDLDVIRTKAWLEGAGIFAGKDNVFGAIKMVAAEHAYHPIRQELDGLIWDQVPRTDTWLIGYLGVEDTPLHRAYGTRFLISMIARVRDPGCKVDTVPILEGLQGLMKSALLRELAGPRWFTDHVPDLASKDAQLQLEGRWLVEFAEYGQLGRAVLVQIA